MGLISDALSIPDAVHLVEISIRVLQCVAVCVAVLHIRRELW